MTAVDRVCSRLERVRKSGSGWTARCPAHEDGSPSLSIGEGDDGRVLLRCHAGCTTEAIVAAIGLELRDLFAESGGGGVIPTRSPATPQHPKRPFDITDEDVRRWHETLIARPGALQRLQELRGWTPEAVGLLAVGLDGEKITFPFRNAEGELTGYARYVPDPARRNGSPKLRAHGRRELFPAIETVEAERVFLVEGEPDAIRLASLGVPAVAVGGVSNWKAKWAERFRGRRVVVCFDCDREGREAARRVATDLATQGQN